MAIPIEVLEAEVLGLPASERSRLVDRLIASLELDPEWEAAWSDEADRREADIAAGRCSWVPADQVLARIGSKLE